ncbi:MAG: ABC transporter permease [Sphingomonadaceae bacterium]
MTLLLHKVAAFVARDHTEATSYRFAFAMRYVNALFTVLTFYFVSGLVEGAATPHLAEYGGDYFAFVLVGIALSGYLRTSLTNFSYLIRNAQMTGTIEALLVTQTELPTVVLASSVYSFVATSTTVLLYLAVGALLFGVNLSGANFLAALLVLLLSIAAFSSIGIASASFIVVFKKGDAVLGAITQISMLLGGVYYPLSILPVWLQGAAALLPITYSLRAMRYALFRPEEMGSVALDVAILAAFAAVALPSSVWLFGRAVRMAKSSGSLGHY